MRENPGRNERKAYTPAPLSSNWDGKAPGLESAQKS